MGKVNKITCEAYTRKSLRKAIQLSARQWVDLYLTLKGFFVDFIMDIDHGLF
jgi:hypothetical protein